MAGSTMGPRVFISYARQDLAAVHDLHMKLEQARLRVWLDQPPVGSGSAESLQPGENWDAALRRTLEGVDFALGIISENSLSKTGTVQKEFRLLLDRQSKMPADRIFFIPVLLEDCGLPNIRVDTIGFGDLHAYELWRRGAGPLIDFLCRGESVDSLLASTARGIVGRKNPISKRYSLSQGLLLSGLVLLMILARNQIGLRELVSHSVEVPEVRILDPIPGKDPAADPPGPFWADSQDETSHPRRSINASIGSPPDVLNQLQVQPGAPAYHQDSRTKFSVEFFEPVSNFRFAKLTAIPPADEPRTETITGAGDSLEFTSAGARFRASTIAVDFESGTLMFQIGAALEGHSE